MTIIVNGEIREFNQNSTIQNVLAKLSLEGKVMAAAVNMQIVKESEWQTYELKEQDKLELLDFVGGG